MTLPIQKQSYLLLVDTADRFFANGKHGRVCSSLAPALVLRSALANTAAGSTMVTAASVSD